MRPMVTASEQTPVRALTGTVLEPRASPGGAVSGNLTQPVLLSVNVFSFGCAKMDSWEKLRFPQALQGGLPRYNLSI